MISDVTFSIATCYVCSGFDLTPIADLVLTFFFCSFSFVSFVSSILQKSTPRFFMIDGEITGGSLSQAKQFFPAQGLGLKPLFDFLSLRLLLTAESTKISAFLVLLFFWTELHSPGV
jgi:hypothetical protein